MDLEIQCMKCLLKLIYKRINNQISITMPGLRAKKKDKGKDKYNKYGKYNSRYIRRLASEDIKRKHKKQSEKH